MSSATNAQRNIEESPQAEELFRYVSASANGLLSVRANGEVYRQTPFSPAWELYATRKLTLSLEEWITKKAEQKSNLPYWQHGISELPSEAELSHWMVDGVASSVTGDSVEPDGHGPDGAPSWLVALGLI